MQYSHLSNIYVLALCHPIQQRIASLIVVCGHARDPIDLGQPGRGRSSRGEADGGVGSWFQVLAVADVAENDCRDLTE